MTQPLTIHLNAAAALVLAVVLGGCGGLNGQPTSRSEPSTTPAPSVAEPSPSVAAGLPEGPHLLWEGTEDGVPITVTIAAPGWVGQPGGGFVEKGLNGADPPDGAGMIAYEGPDYYVYGDPCRWSTTGPDTPATTVDELVEALANQASREASAPEDITVDGYAGKKILLDMADDVDFDACDDGTFALFGLASDDFARYSQGPDQIEEVWAVDVDGLLAVGVGAYYADTPQDVVDEVRAILGSMTFDE